MVQKHKFYPHGRLAAGKGPVRNTSHLTLKITLKTAIAAEAFYGTMQCDMEACVPCDG